MPKFHQFGVVFAIVIASLVLLGQPAFSQPGSLDPTFGVGGKIRIPKERVSTAVLDPGDQSTIVAGETGMYRILSSGAPDPNFGNRGRAEFKEPMKWSAATIASGKIVLCGTSKS